MGTVTAVTGLIIPKTNIGVRWPLIDVFALWLTPTESTPLKNTEEGRGGLGGTQVIIKEEELHVLLRTTSSGLVPATPVFTPPSHACH